MSLLVSNNNQQKFLRLKALLSCYSVFLSSYRQESSSPYAWSLCVCAYVKNARSYSGESYSERRAHRSNTLGSILTTCVCTVSLNIWEGATWMLYSLSIWTTSHTSFSMHYFEIGHAVRSTVPDYRNELIHGWRNRIVAKSVQNINMVT